MVAVRLHPGLRGARGEAVVGVDGAARVLGAHHAEHALQVGIREIGACFVLQDVFDDRRMAAMGANHARDLGLHVALGESIGLAGATHGLVAAAGSRQRISPRRS